VNLPNNQLKYRKRIGYVGHKPVFEVATLGGLVVVAEQESGGKLKTLGAGSHRAMARYLAKKAAPSMEVDALEKSESINPEDFKEFLSFWEQVTEKLRNG